MRRARVAQRRQAGARGGGLLPPGALPRVLLRYGRAGLGRGGAGMVWPACGFAGAGAAGRAGVVDRGGAVDRAGGVDRVVPVLRAGAVDRAGAVLRAAGRAGAAVRVLRAVAAGASLVTRMFMASCPACSSAAAAAAPLAAPPDMPRIIPLIMALIICRMAGSESTRAWITGSAIIRACRFIICRSCAVPAVSLTPAAAGVPCPIAAWSIGGCEAEAWAGGCVADMGMLIAP